MSNMKNALLALGIVCMVMGCADAGDPKGVTVAFCETLRSGGLEEARPHMTRASQILVDRGARMGLSGAYSIGTVQEEGDQATVTILDSDSDQEFDAILFREEGEWKIDLARTLSSMYGKDVAGALGALGAS